MCACDVFRDAFVGDKVIRCAGLKVSGPNDCGLGWHSRVVYPIRIKLRELMRTETTMERADCFALLQPARSCFIQGVF